jgi:hypothetical protein
MSMTDSDSGSVPQVASDRSFGVLDSWKSIASHLGRTVRTAQRWQRYEGMPVRYHLHRKATTVYAFRDELDQWRVSRSQKKLAPSAADEAREEVQEQNHFIATVPSSYFRSFVSLSVDSGKSDSDKPCSIVQTQDADATTMRKPSPISKGNRLVTTSKKPRLTVRVIPRRSRRTLNVEQPKEGVAISMCARRPA